MLLKKMLYAYYETQCVYAVSQLNVAEHLCSGQKSIQELSQRVNCNEHKLYRIMRFLSAKGLFDELPDQYFALNDESCFLLSSTPGNLKKFVDLHATYFYQGASNILESMNLEKTPFELHFGEPAWKLFQENPEAGKTYNEAMREVSDYYSQQVITRYDFSPYKVIIDIGGGLGTLLANILKAHPHSRGINFDLPYLETDAEKYFESQHVSSRCQYQGGSFFESIPSGGDLYLFKAIFHGKSDDDAIQILNNLKKVLPKTSKALLIERLIAPGLSFLDGCSNDINMLNVSFGGVRSLAEYRALFNYCGFSISNAEPLEDAMHIIEIVLGYDSN